MCAAAQWVGATVGGADLQSSRAMAWLASWLVPGTVRVTRSGLVVNRRSLLQAAGGVLQSQARVALGKDLVCRAGHVVQDQATSSMHSKACGQRGVPIRYVAATSLKCALEAARCPAEGRVTGGRPV